ncbi:MAG: hypothetical protein WA960_00505, partial [Tunicatimonas sp.]
MELDAFNNEVRILQNETVEGFALLLQDKQIVWALKVDDSLKVEVPSRSANPVLMRRNLKFLDGMHHGDSSSLL